jgi:hypothetical protein
MKKRNISAVFLSICLIVTMLSVGSPHAHAVAPNSDKRANLNHYVIVDPHTIGITTVLLERRNSTTLLYRVTASSPAGPASMSATIVLQRLESGRWVNRETINVTQNNTMRLNAANTINISAHGAGSYRIRVTFRSVVNGITTTLTPRYSTMVVM